MKKIYLSLMSLVFAGSVIAQNPFITPTAPLEQGFIDPNTVAPTNKTNKSRGIGPFDLWVEPVNEIMTQKGLTLDFSASANQIRFLSAVYQDSTVKIGSPSSTRPVSEILMGSVLDPKSSFIQDSYEPILSKNDPYKLDSIVILGSYVKVTPTVDTLYVWIVWGDTTNTSVFAKRLTNATYVQPIASWRTSVLGPKVSGATGAAGNKVKPSAPTSNMRLIKYVLQQQDSSIIQRSKYIDIPLGTSITIPANNVVSCMYTFVPGAVAPSGSICYGFPGGPTQTVNGFCSIIWGQQIPAVTALGDYRDHQVDPNGFNMGVSYDKFQRHAKYTGTFLTDVLGDLLTAPWVYYKISGTATSGVSEFNNTFSLSQNQPNPFGGKTIINYNMKKEGANVSFEVYDIKGSLVYEDKTLNSKQGLHSIELNSADLNAGVYFYSLIVDGNKITKKMVITTSK